MEWTGERKTAGKGEDPWKGLSACPAPPRSAPPPRRSLLELLARRRVKRLVLLGDGRTAVVEIPVENTESNFDSMTYNRRDLRWAGGECKRASVVGGRDLAGDMRLAPGGG